MDGGTPVNMVSLSSVDVELCEHPQLAAGGAPPPRNRSDSQATPDKDAPAELGSQHCTSAPVRPLLTDTQNAEGCNVNQTAEGESRLRLSVALTHARRYIG